MSQIIGNHKLVMYPDEYVWKDDTLIITKTNIISDDEYQNMLEK